MSSFVTPISWRCPRCLREGDSGHCCEFDGRAFARVPVFPTETTDHQIAWSIPAGGPCAAHLSIDRLSGEIRTAGLAQDVRLGVFGPEGHPVPPGAPEGIVAFIDRPPAEGGWFYGWALESSDSLSNPAGPFASEEEALEAAGYPGEYVEYPPHLTCGQARRRDNGDLYVGCLVLIGW